MNLGGVHVHRGEYEKAAFFNFLSGLDYFEELGVPAGWPKKFIGDLYLDMGDAEKAQSLLKEAGHNSSLGRLHLIQSQIMRVKRAL